MTALLIALACLLLAAGVAGVLLPALPGLPLMFAGVWLLAYAQDYAVMGAGALVLTGALAAAGTLLDYVAGLLGARLSGASTRALWGAALGGVLGMALGLPGLALGPLLGAALGEYLARRQILAAGKVGIAAFLGFVAGVAAKTGCALAILLIVLVFQISQWV